MDATDTTGKEILIANLTRTLRAAHNLPVGDTRRTRLMARAASILRRIECIDASTGALKPEKARRMGIIQ